MKSAQGSASDAARSSGRSSGLSEADEAETESRSTHTPGQDSQVRLVLPSNLINSPQQLHIQLLPTTFSWSNR